MLIRGSRCHGCRGGVTDGFSPEKADLALKSPKIVEVSRVGRDFSPRMGILTCFCQQDGKIAIHP